MKTEGYSARPSANGVSTMTVQVNLPGMIMDMHNNTVTLDVPVVDGPALITPEGKRVLSDGLSEIEAEVLLERIAHFAVTESMRSHMTFKQVTVRTSHSEPVRAI